MKSISMVIRELENEALQSDDPLAVVLGHDSKAWTQANRERKQYRLKLHMKSVGYGENVPRVRNAVLNMFRNARGPFVGSLKRRGNTKKLRHLPSQNQREEVLARLGYVRGQFA